MALKGRIVTALLSDVGRVRANNEDSIAEDGDIGLLVLADGMGGHNAGEVASGIAAATIIEVSRREWPRLQHGRIDRDSGYRVETLLLRHALQIAHADILQAAQSQPQCAGMGTTVVVCLLHDDRMSVAYAGDSRLYRLRAGNLQQITRDHSLLEALLANSRYSRKDAEQRVRRNVVTRALGVEHTVQVDLMEAGLQPGDIVLLCSDGLTDMVDDDAIRATLVQLADHLDAAAQTLIRQANERGGRDNISVMLARVDAPFPRAAAAGGA